MPLLHLVQGFIDHHMKQAVSSSILFKLNGNVSLRGLLLFRCGWRNKVAAVGSTRVG